MSKFKNIKGVQHLQILSEKNNSLLAISLNCGNTCLYNPIVNSHESCVPFKSISHIVSPNHYHNKSLARFQEAFPKAVLCSSKKAKVRLEKITKLELKLLTSLKKHLPVGMELLEPDGLKTGEVWLRFNYGKSCGWIVGDAFCGSKTTTKETKTPLLLGTFPSYGIEDKATYMSWVSNRIDVDRPTLLVPCHGCVIRDTSLPDKLKALVKKI